ncbi:MAG: protein of unknown function, putative Histidine kinase [Verrucomicrobia bacterium]|nr:protein of unknown function, putative Histidine kinase [Verrucomicrobiota bacterium]
MMISRRFSVTSPTSPSTPPAAPRSILIVDDDPAMGAALRHSIGAAGYNVVVATCGKEALAMANDETIDAALIDFEMAPMDGIELCRQLISRKPKSKPFPIWIMTGGFSADRWAAAIKAGAIDLFPKPFERERFLGELTMAWAASQSGRPNAADGIRLVPT